MRQVHRGRREAFVDFSKRPEFVGADHRRVSPPVPWNMTVLRGVYETVDGRASWNEMNTGLPVTETAEGDWVNIGVWPSPQATTVYAGPIGLLEMIRRQRFCLVACSRRPMEGCSGRLQATGLHTLVLNPALGNGKSLAATFMSVRPAVCSLSIDDAE